jgi:4-hydroxybenzoate polyprenyltransferase
MFRLLALLQLTRAALAFTAIADAWTVLLLHVDGEPVQKKGLSIAMMVVMAIVSFGLYAFGMALNDLLDARRDRLFAPRRPIPSGRIQPHWAVMVALGLLMAAFLGAALMMPLSFIKSHAVHESVRSEFIPYSFLFAFATAWLIVLYDATTKYLGGVGLLTLGAIRALHCLIGNPKTPVLFLSIILFTHVVVVSTIAYRLENKRPRLRWRDVWIVAAGVGLGDALALAYMWLRGALTPANCWMLIGPGIAAAVYVVWAMRLFAGRKMSRRQKGERLMLMGLFWLFVYDATMLLSNGQYLAGAAITFLLLCAIASFFGIRWLSRHTGAGKIDYRPHRAEPVAAPKAR